MTTTIRTRLALVAGVAVTTLVLAGCSSSGDEPDANSITVSTFPFGVDRKSTRLNSSHLKLSRMPSSA